MQSAYMTVAEVADILDISTSGVYKLIERDKLPAIRRSERGLRVSRLALDAYQRRLQGVHTQMTVEYQNAPLEKLRAAFERETKLSPAEWERRWKDDRFEDNAANMRLAIRALSLLLNGQDERREATSPYDEPVSARRSAA